MKSINLKRIAAAGVLSGALSVGALGLGAGTANADDGNIPFVPGGGSGGDFQSYFPMIERLGDVANFAKIGNLGGTGGKGNSESLGGLGSLGNLGNIGSLGNLGSIGNLGGGQWQDFLGMLGG
jgi:hypothetical protein